MENKLKPGTYEHFKGNKYEVIGVAMHSETGEKMVVYQALYGKRKMWVRPLEMFKEKVGAKGQKTPRFRFIKTKT